MPELPEVEFGRKLFEQAAKNKTITKVVCTEDEIVFEGKKAKEVRKHLLKKKVLSVHRKGKYIWVELSKKPWPIFHFGMTGAFRLKDHTPLKLVSHGEKVDTAWPPKFSKVILTFDDDTELAFTNARRLGKVLFQDDVLNQGPISKLGFDPLTTPLSKTAFKEEFSKRKKNIKGLLLDQSFAAGVGNWIADEILYQAGIDPRRSTTTLTDKEIAALHKKLEYIISRAVSVDALKSKFPKSWLFHYRWKKKAGAKTHKGETIEFIDVAGRTTAWVPEKQK